MRITCNCARSALVFSYTPGWDKRRACEDSPCARETEPSCLLKDLLTMSSIRLLEKLIESEKPKDVEGTYFAGSAFSCLRSCGITVGAYFLSGTHCLVEWNEPGNPRNVVRRKSVHTRGAERLQAGVKCDVEIGVGKKRSMYEARVLGIGEINVHSRYSCVPYTSSVCVGEKCSMDEMLLEIEEETSEETGGTEETEREETEAVGRTGMETGGTEETEREETEAMGRTGMETGRTEETEREETETMVEVGVMEDQWEIGGIGQPESEFEDYQQPETSVIRRKKQLVSFATARKAIIL